MRQRRRELNLTQEQLAERAGLSKSFLSEVEGGQVAADGLIYLRIAECLEVSVEWLLQGEVAPPPPARPDIPPALSALADELGWTHSETLDVAAALQTVIARRSRRKALGARPGGAHRARERRACPTTGHYKGKRGK